MKYEVLNGDVVIGTSDLEHHDKGMNVRVGRVRPLEPYFAIQHIFRAVSDAIEQRGPNQAQALATAAQVRATLAVSVRERGGEVLPSSAIHIADYEEFPDDLEIAVFPPTN